MLKNLIKHCKIYWLFMKICIATQMEYRVNFFMSFALECCYLLAKLMYISVIYRTGVIVDGISPDAVLLIIGTHAIITGFYVGLFVNNFYRLTYLIRNGELDLNLTKPVSTQFLVTLRYFDLGLFIPEVVGGLIMVIIGWSRLGIALHPLDILVYTGMVIINVLSTYSIFLLPQLLTFWFVKTSALNGVVDQLWEANNMPMGIYAKPIQRIGTFIFPIFVLSNFPIMQLLKKLSPILLAWFFMTPIIFFMITRLVWNYALKKYSSVSS